MLDELSYSESVLWSKKMMKTGCYIIIYGLFILALLVGRTYAGETREIEFIDGSMISAEILSLHDGVYTLKSASLGTIKVEESKIRAIRMKAQEKASGPDSQPLQNPDMAGQVKSLQDKMTGNQEIMDMIRSLKDDPDFRKVMEDPEIMKSVESGDIGSLLANRRFLNLLNNAKVKEIEKKVKE